MEKHFKFSDLGITDYSSIDSIKHDCDPESKVVLSHDGTSSFTQEDKITNVNELGFTLIGDKKDIESLIECIKAAVGA